MHSKKTLYRKYPFNNILKFRPKKHSGLKLWITDIVLNSKNWKFIQKKNQGSTSTVRTITIFFLTHYFVNLKSNSTLLYNKGHNLLTSALPPKHVKLIKFHWKVQYFPSKRIISLSSRTCKFSSRTCKLYFPPWIHFIE